MKHILWFLASIAVFLATLSGVSACAATLIVTNLSDTGVAGDGSLPGEIAAAGSGDTIVFQPGLTGTITLTSGALTISQNLTITGPGPSVIAVSGANSFRVFSITGGTAFISGLTIENGSAPDGAGIFNDSTLTITNCIISGNSAVAAGGGIFNTIDSTLTVTNGTISGNTAGGSGGGIFNITSTATLKSTILANEPSGGNCVGTITSLGYNLSDDGTCGLGATGDLNNTPAGLDSNGLQNNGGPTPTIALLVTSPAVDAIPVAACTDQSTPPVPVLTDQRYVLRPQGLACDIGAYELIPPDGYLIRYASNVTTLGDSLVNLSNTGAIDPSPGIICADIYVFDPNEEELDCCSCQITPNALQSLSVTALLSNNLTPEHPGSVVIKLLATGLTGTTCDPTSAGTRTNPLVPGLRAWGTTLHQTGGTPNITYGTETEFSLAGSTLSQGELNRLTGQCSFIKANGSGNGQCGGCSPGGR